MWNDLTTATQKSENVMQILDKHRVKKEQKIDPQKGKSGIDQWIISSSSAPSLMMLIYGEDGTGKTGIAFEYPKPMLVIDLDGGSVPILQFHKNKKIDICSPLVITNGKVDYQGTIDRILEILRYVKENKTPYECVVLDGVSTLLKFCEYSMRWEIGKSAADGVETRFWQIRAKKFNEIIVAMRLLGKDVIWIAHEDFILSDEEKTASVKLRLNQMAFQKLRCVKTKVGRELKYTAIVDKSKYSPAIEGKQMTFLTIDESGKIDWKGGEVMRWFQ